MMDPRSSPDAHVWVGGDNRVHCESASPPLSVFGVLDTWYWAVTEERGFDSRQQCTVATLAGWLDNQLDWLCRHEMVADFAEDVQLLVRQLRPVTGERQSPIATCPRINDGRVCRAKLYEPDADGVIACPRCYYEWPRDKWIGHDDDCLMLA
jgi:hypothetical protein